MVFFQAHLLKKKKQIGDNLVPTYNFFVYITNKLKTKGYEEQRQKSKKEPFEIIRVVLCRKLLKNTLNIRKMTRRWKAAKLAILQGP